LVDLLLCTLSCCAWHTTDAAATAGRNAKLLAQPLDELNPHSAGAASETQHASPGSKGAVLPTEPAEVIDSTGEQSHSHATASPPLTADSRVPAKRHVGCGDIPEEEPPEHVVCGSAHYGKEHGKGLAWQVRPDGSAMAQWPGRRNQALAVSVDKEGRRFRLYAAYKDKGTMAVSFDSAGNGVVNTKSGKVCFQHNSKRGGFCIDANTGAKQVWASGDLPNANVDIQLDETLGFRWGTYCILLKAELVDCVGLMLHAFELRYISSMRVFDTSLSKGIMMGARPSQIVRCSRSHPPSVARRSHQSCHLMKKTGRTQDQSLRS